MIGKISYRELVILLISFSVITTVLIRVLSNDVGVIIPTATISESKGAETGSGGGGQVSLTIIPQNESSQSLNKSFTNST